MTREKKKIMHLMILMTICRRKMRSTKEHKVRTNRSRHVGPYEEEEEEEEKER